MGEQTVCTDGHEPEVYATGRHGCWAHCSCGWESRSRKSVSGASLAWAVHLSNAMAGPA